MENNMEAAIELEQLIYKSAGIIIFIEKLKKGVIYISGENKTRDLQLREGVFY